MNGDLNVCRPDPKPQYATRRHTVTAKQMRVAVAERSGGICEVRLAGCAGAATAIHHRKLRAQGGTNDLANLLHESQSLFPFLRDRLPHALCAWIGHGSPYTFVLSSVYGVDRLEQRCSRCHAPFIGSVRRA